MNDHDLRQFLENFARDHGDVIDIDLLVDEARDEDSPIHGEFNWNVEAAARAHWRDQARALVRRAKVTLIITPERRVRVPVFIHNPDNGGRVQGYSPLSGIARESSRACTTLDVEIARVIGSASRALGVAHQIGSVTIQTALREILTRAENAQAEVQNYRPPPAQAS